MGHYTSFLLSLLLSTIALLCWHQNFLAQSDNPQEPPTALHLLYLPLVHTKANSSVDVPAQPFVPLEWDARLTERGARLIQAQVAPGAGYWRLIKARWYNEAEAQGRHNIFIDILDQSNQRISNIPILVGWRDDETHVTTERKAGELYATDFAMFAVAPAYAAQPATNDPADRVEGMGLGSIEAPSHTIHTSYGLVWQWTVTNSAPSPTATATITIALTPTATVAENADPIPWVTPTPTMTMTELITPTSTPSSTLSSTPSPMPSPTSTPSPTASATSTATPTAIAPFTPTPTVMPSPTATGSSLAQAVVVGCQPNDRGSRFEGYVYVNGQPTDGHRVVFSYEADGPWVTQPALSGSGKPGFYTHIISVGVPRVGNWYGWLIDQNQRRISTLAAFATDGANGACNVVSVNFLIQQ